MRFGWMSRHAYRNDGCSRAVLQWEIVIIAWHTAESPDSTLPLRISSAIYSMISARLVRDGKCVKDACQSNGVGVCGLLCVCSRKDQQSMRQVVGCRSDQCVRPNSSTKTRTNHIEKCVFIQPTNTHKHKSNQRIEEKNAQVGRILFVSTIRFMRMSWAIIYAYHYAWCGETLSSEGVFSMFLVCCLSSIVNALLVKLWIGVIEDKRIVIIYACAYINFSLIDYIKQEKTHTSIAFERTQHHIHKSIIKRT